MVTPHPNAQATITTDLLVRPEIVRLIGLLRVHLGFPPEFFVRAVRPLLRALAAPESPHGDLTGSEDTREPEYRLHQTLTAACRALARRHAVWLPRGVPPEICGDGAPRWTYAVLVAAIAPDPRTGQSLIGQLPAPIYAWLQADPTLLAELSAVLDGAALPGSALATLLSPAAQGQVADTGAVPKQTRTPALARAFMEWLQAEVASGRLPVNQPGSAVRGVPEGLLLVSPFIFRAFARALPAAGTVTEIQRAVLRAGWHLRGAAGVTMLAYTRRPLEGLGTPTERVITGIVLREPQRFLTPVPPCDPTLVRITAQAS